MRKLPSVSVNTVTGVQAREPEAGRSGFPEIWGIALRRWKVITWTTLCGGVLAAGLVLSDRPQYQASTLLRIQEKQPNLPEVFRTLAGTQVATEMAELRSRSLAEEATRSLGLQLRLVDPEGVARSAILTDIWVESDVKPASYQLVRTTRRTFAVMRRGRKVGEISIGDGIRLEGLSFRLAPAAARYPRLRLSVRSMEQAAADVRDGTDVKRVDRDADMITLKYTSADPDLAWRVPNAIAVSFTARRQELQRSETRSTIEFLREQLDTLSRQLAQSEQAFRVFKERERTVNPDAEAGGQVDRLISMQGDRARIEAERAALSKMVDEVRAASDVPRADQPSPFRRLMAFPTLLRNGASPELLGSLAALEKERNDLLVRRTPRDPEVQAVARRIAQIEEQLRTTAETYLEGLTNQVRAADTTLAAFGHELRMLPAKQVEYARLERTPKVLEGISTLLQTRLKEAEISQGVEHDASIRVVDAATPPLGPVRSHRPLYGAALIIAGLLSGIGLAVTREFLDSSVHTRADVLSLTGLPVIGLIPHIRRIRDRAPLLPAVHRKGAGSLPRLKRSGGLPHRVRHAQGANRAGVRDRVAQQQTDRAEAQTGSSGPGDVAVASQSEAYDILQTNLAFLQPEWSRCLLLFTSPLPSDGKTTTAVNLAISLAHRGRRTLLIDADLRRGVVHHLFRVPREPGLREVLDGSCPWAEARRVVQVEGGEPLHYLTTGQLPRSPTGMMDSAQCRNLLLQVRNEYEAIILDAPPATLVPDAALLGAMADGVIVVARAGVTDAAALTLAVEHLSQMHIKVVGVVLNDINFAKEAAYDGAYRLYDSDAYLSASDEGSQ